MLTVGTTTYQYDADGFLKNRTDGTTGAADYVYSSRGELLKVTLTAQLKVVEYVHDPLGRRIAKKVNGVIVEKYLWQGMTRLLAVFDGNDNPLMRFEYADARMPFAMTMGTTTYHLAYDQVGSLRVVADGSGNPVKQIGYDSFGNIIAETNPTMKIPFGFAGGLHDRDTGLVRFGFRDYDPDTGRWTAKDPIRFKGGDTDLYGYCVNDPVNWADPWGLTGGYTGVLGGIGFGVGIGVTIAGAPVIGIGIALAAMLAIPGDSNPALESSRFPGYMPGPKGAEEWGRRNNIDPAEARRRFHGVKGGCKGSRPNEDYSVNPETGDVADSNGESVGNLEDAK